MNKMKQIMAGLTLGLALVGGAMLAPALSSTVHAQPVAANDPNDPLGVNYGAQTGLTSTDIRATVGKIINSALALLGIVTVVIFIWGGFEYLTSGGEAEKTKGAKDRMIAAVIGLIIILCAYAVTRFVIGTLLTATSQSSQAVQIQ